MTPENRYTCTLFIDNDVIYCKWGGGIFSSHDGALQKISEKHCCTDKCLLIGYCQNITRPTSFGK